MTESSPVVVPLGSRRPGRSGGGGDHGRSGGGGGARQPGDWRDKLTRTTTGKPESTVHNAMLVMEHDDELGGLFWLDDFANAVRLSRTPCWPGGDEHEFSEQDGTEVAAWIGSPDRYMVNLKKDLVLDCVEAIARRRKVHPVREYLSGLTWDQTPRLETMFRRYFSAEDTPYTREAAKCWLVSAVARIMWTDQKVRHNGAQVDFMLVLEGEQGRGKTSAVRVLFGAEWYAEAQESPSSKDFYQALRGRWCVEIGEMDSFSKADVTKVKQAITARFDTYRPSYGRVARSFRRECVFVGTTNETEYLRDATGARRFLPIRVGSLDLAGIVADRDQLWAEAVALFRAGFAWWSLPDEAVEQQEERFAEDSWQGVIQRWLSYRMKPNCYPDRLAVDLPPAPSPADTRESASGTAERPARPTVTWTTTTELLIYALNIDVGKHGRPEQMRVAHVMKRLGWSHERKVLSDGTRERRWAPRIAGKEPHEAPF